MHKNSLEKGILFEIERDHQLKVKVHNVFFVVMRHPLFSFLFEPLNGLSFIIHMVLVNQFNYLYHKLTPKVMEDVEPFAFHRIDTRLNTFHWIIYNVEAFFKLSYLIGRHNPLSILFIMK